MTNADITTLINQERSRIVNKTSGKEVVLTIELKSGKVLTFLTNEVGEFLATIVVMNEMVKIPVLIKRESKTELNSETNQFQNKTKSEYKYYYIDCENIDFMYFSFNVIDVNDVNISNPIVNTDENQQDE